MALSGNPYYDDLKLYAGISGGGGIGGGGGGDSDDIGPLYKSIHYQRGYGVGFVDPFPFDTYGLGFGDSISQLFRLAVPYLKQGLKHVGHRVVEGAASLAKQAIEGKSLPEAAKEALSKTSEQLVAKAPAVLERLHKGFASDVSPVSRTVTAAVKRRRAPPVESTRRKRRRGTTTSKFGRGLISSYPVLGDL